MSRAGCTICNVKCLLYAVNGVDGSCCLEQAVQHMFGSLHLSARCIAPHVVLQMPRVWCYLCTFRCEVFPFMYATMIVSNAQQFRGHLQCCSACSDTRTDASETMLYTFKSQLTQKVMMVQFSLPQQQDQAPMRHKPHHQHYNSAYETSPLMAPLHCWCASLLQPCISLMVIQSPLAPVITIVLFGSSSSSSRLSSMFLLPASPTTAIGTRRICSWCTS